MTTLQASAAPSRVGFVGAGGIAPEHVDALRLIPGVEIAAVCDFDLFRAQKLAAESGIPNTYGSLTEMLQLQKLDVVHVLTQPQYHVPVALECIRAGVNVYVEKPLALSVQDCEVLQAEADAHGCVVGVNHQFAHFDPVEAIIQAARDRRFGRINHVSVSYCVAVSGLPVKETGHYMFSTPQALLFEYCPHPFSVIRRLMGKPLDVRSLASGKTVLDNGKIFYRNWDINAVADRGSAHLYFAAGVGNAHFTVDVYGQDATASADIWRGTLLFHENVRQPISATMRDGLTNAKRLFQQAMGNMVNDRLTRVKMRPLSSTNRFYPTMSAFYGSLRAGKPVQENGQAARDVIAYAEMAANNVVTVD